MNNLNLVGNITRDLEIINTNSGTMLAKCGLAVNKKVQGVDKTMFIDITFFGKTAEIATQYLHKGSKIGVSGSLELDSWDDAQTGAKRSKHTMAVNQMTMLDSNPNAGQNQGGQQYDQNQNNGGYQAPQQQNNGQQYQNQGNGAYQAPQQQQYQPQQNNQNNGGQQQMNMNNNQNQNQGGNMPEFNNNGGGQGNQQ